MSVFEYEDYKKFINDLIASMPKRGHGQFRKMAEALKVNSVVMSQIFRGERDLTLEQANTLCTFFGLRKRDRAHFLLLVQYARAGTHDLREVLKEQISESRENAAHLKSRLPQEKRLSEEAKGVFYSSWQYSAVRLASSIPGKSDVEKIARFLKLPRDQVARIIDFLLVQGLCVERTGVLEMGPKRTHLGNDSPYVLRHRLNWRIKALEHLEKVQEKRDLSYSGPMALSRAAALKIREELARVIERASDIAVASDSETLACLNIDWFQPVDGT